METSELAKIKEDDIMIKGGEMMKGEFQYEQQLGCNSQMPNLGDILDSRWLYCTGRALVDLHPPLYPSI